MADPRYRKVRTLDRDGVVRTRRIKKENLGKYGAQVVNARGKKALEEEK